MERNALRVLGKNSWLLEKCMKCIIRFKERTGQEREKNDESVRNSNRKMVRWKLRVDDKRSVITYQDVTTEGDALFSHCFRMKLGASTAREQNCVTEPRVVYALFALGTVTISYYWPIRKQRFHSNVAIRATRHDSTFRGVKIGLSNGEGR